MYSQSDFYLPKGYALPPEFYLKGYTMPPEPMEAWQEA